MRHSLKKYLLDGEAALKSVGLRCEASTFDTCLFFVFRAKSGSVGVFLTLIDDILGRGESNVLAKMRIPPEHRYREFKLQESSFVHVGVALARGHTFSVTLTQSEFATNLQPVPTTPKLWAARQKHLPPEDVHMRQCKLGELHWLATVS